MKILVAIIPSSPNRLKTTLWAPRAGFSFRMFVGRKPDLAGYMAAVDHANYDQYLDLKYSSIVRARNPIKYGQPRGFDLLLLIPPDLAQWNDNPDWDDMVVEYAVDVAATRSKFSKDLKKTWHQFKNGAKMVRL